MLQILWGLAIQLTLQVESIGLRQLIRIFLSRMRWPLLVLTVTGIGLFASFFSLGSYETLTSHEAYNAVPAREMLESGEWILPEFGSRPRLQKPPLHYWFVAGSYQFFQEMSEWTARFPSAVSAILLGVLVGYWSSKWYGKKVGLLAFLVQMTSVYSLKYGHRALVDLPLCLMITTSLFLAAPGTLKEEPSRTGSHISLKWFAFWILTGLSFLAKFHYGPVMILAPMVVFFLVQKDWCNLKKMFHPIGLVIISLFILIWPALILKRNPEAWHLWISDSVIRSVQGSEPVWYYLRYLLVFSLPWGPLVLGKIQASWNSAWKENNARERFLWVWFFTQMLILTFSATKRSHYLLPVLPVISILASRKLEEIISRLRNQEQVITKGQAVVCALMSGVLSCLLFWGIARKWEELLIPAFLLSLSVLIGFCSSVFLLYRKHWKLNLAVNCITYVLLLSLIFKSTLPVMDERESEVKFVNSLNLELNNQQKLSVYKLGMHASYFYLESPLLRTERLMEIQAEAKKRMKKSQFSLGIFSWMNSIRSVRLRLFDLILMKRFRETQIWKIWY